MSRRRLLLAVAGIACGAALLGVAVTATSRAQHPGPPAVDTPQAAADRFLQRYVEPDGRVVRADQGGDTVSEGQAYGMLLSVAVGDEQRFGEIWRWTTEHLEQPDGLFAWHWADGRILDPQSASDADLDIARALLLAAARFDRPDYRTEASRVGQAILEHETVQVGGQPELVAGPWARTAPYAVNPSYLSPVAFDLLHRATQDPRWLQLGRSGLRSLEGLTASPPHLPPDWAVLDPGGAISSSAAPGSGAGPQYGVDAARVPIRFAEACDPADRSAAAAMWPFLRQASLEEIVSSYTLGGQPVATDQDAVGLVAAAAAASAAGDHGAASTLLDRAQTLDERSPTYYGAAWVALGRFMLTTDVLGGCAA